MPETPLKIGKYTILQRIGRGGMGYVYRAHDPILKRDVALKTMLREVSDDEDLRNRFMREAQSAGGLRHPNIVTIYDLGEDEKGCPYIAMEFLTGTDLEHLIKNRVDLGLLKKIDIIIQTCDGLGYAHANGIVHRDIKTANIRLLDNGQVKIMDFGIAKMTASHFTRTGMIMGTPHYMAPEQIRGEKVDGRADIFSLGVVLYELLTFRKPFPGDNPTTVLFKIIHENPEPLVDSLFVPPEGLEDIVARALAKKAEERYQTCEEMAEDLRFIYSMLQQQGYEANQGTGPQGAWGQPGITPVPTIHRPKTSPGTSPPLFQPATGTGVPGLTLPSQQRLRTQHPDSTSQMPHDIPVQQPQETHLQPHTSATLAPTLAGKTQLKPPTDLPPITPTPVPSPARMWWILGSSGILGIVILVIALKIFWKQPEPPSIGTSKSVITEPKKETPFSTEAGEGWITLNVQPWAEIKEIKNEKGETIIPPFSITPCKLKIPTGKYKITLTNPDFETKIIEVEIKENETLAIHETLKGFDRAKAIDSLGL